MIHHHTANLLACSKILRKFRHIYRFACCKEHLHPHRRTTSSSNLCLRSSSDWRQTNLFASPQSTRARSENPWSLPSSILLGIPHHQVQRYTSIVYLKATFIKRFANSLKVAKSVGRSAPTDPDHFWRSATLLRLRSSFGPVFVVLLGRRSISSLSVTILWA